VSPWGNEDGTEHLAQVYWRNFGVDVCFWVAFNRLITRTLVGEPFHVFGDGEQTRVFTFVADAVSATILAGEHGRPGGAYNIGGGSRRSMNNVLDALDALTGTPVNRVYVGRQRGDARDTAADIALARADLGYEPSFEFDAGLNAQLEWQRARSRRPVATPLMG
jgi:UDP-glucose 4-epimerase